MKLHFDFSNIVTTEFGIGQDDGDGRTIYGVVTDKSVQEALEEMAITTWENMNTNDSEPAVYDPSEKYGSAEYVYLPINDEHASWFKQLHHANNLTNNSNVLNETDDMFCYFVRFIDRKRNRLTAVRRAAQFKGILKNKLIKLLSDALKIIEDNVFKLDADFDLIVDKENVYILRPSGFEFIGQLQEAIKAAVPKNIIKIKKEINFIDFENIQSYALEHPRAARYLASIRTRKRLKDIDKKKLEQLCAKTKVELKPVDGKLVVEDKQIMGLLEVLDRRRYLIELIKDEPESYRAAARSSL